MRRRRWRPTSRRPECPIAAELTAPACAEGGDTLWLDERTLVVGLGYRTNEAGAAQLAEALQGIKVIPVDLPHHHGPGEVLHLLSLISPVDRDLAVVYLPLMPVRLVELLREREIDLFRGIRELPQPMYEPAAVLSRTASSARAGCRCRAS